MDIFTDVKDSAYQTGRFFYPHENGNVDAYAVTQETGKYLIAVYAVLFSLVATKVWQLVATLVMAFHKVPERNETAEDPEDKQINMAIAGFWNAREPVGTTLFMAGYFGKVLRYGKTPRVKLYVWGLFLLSILGAVVVVVCPVFVSEKMVLGMAAPARLSSVFIPDLPNQMTNYDLQRLQALRAPAALRAIGSAEGGSVTVGDKVKIDDSQHVSASASDNEPLNGFTYGYSLTGWEMGLQKYPTLRQDVTGECVTAYDWYDKKQDDFDVYRPWNVPNTTILVPRSGEANSAPRVQALAFPYNEKSDPRVDLPANNTYGIFVFSAGRKSYRGSSDIWYSTEPAEGNTSQPDAPTLRVRTKRPALSCWQQDTWVHNGKKYKNIYELTSSSELNLPKGWSKLLQLEFSQPRIVSVINSAGPSALVSSMTFSGISFDAETSSFRKDMARLLVASRISSTHVFRDSVMVTEFQNFDNGAEGTNRKPEPGVADFVIITPQVTAVRFATLVAVPATLGTLTILLAFVQLLKRGALVKNLAWYEGAYLYGRGDGKLGQDKDFRLDNSEKPSSWSYLLTQDKNGSSG